MLKRLGYIAVLAAVHSFVGITWSSLIMFSICLLSTLYIVVPLMFRYIPAVSRHMVFLPFVNWASKERLTNPSKAGVSRARNFYLTTEDGVRLGVWQILPLSNPEPESESMPSGDTDDAEQTFVQLLSASGGGPVIFYNHGNSGSRAGPHRVELYHVLQRLNCHIVAFDYRGYADSSDLTPTETGVVSDSRFVYKWIRRYVPASRIVVWGHSLGTGVTSRLVAELCAEGDSPAGLILESPFNNIREEVEAHSFSLLHRKMPGFSWFILDPLQTFDICFESDRHMARVTVPVSILHAEDDIIVPHRLGIKLYESARQCMRGGQVEFHSFPSSLGLGHKFICRSDRLPDIVRNFLLSTSAAPSDS